MGDVLPSFQILAPAKINLSLEVVGRRNDGFHLLSSLVGFADICDMISVRPANNDQLMINGAFENDLRCVNADDLNGNILGRILSEFRTHFAPNLPPMEITLTKNLPVGSGIGGGSSDAAALLRALFHHFSKNTEPSERLSFALQFGADLPVCLEAQPCLMSGIGEGLASVSIAKNSPAILINPRKSLSTPAVFKAFRELDIPFSNAGDMPAEQEINLHTNEKIGCNDLMRPAVSLCPEIEAIINVLAQDQYVLSSGMSGSGATCFALFRDFETQEIMSKKLKKIFPTYWIKNTMIGNCPIGTFP